MKLVKDLLKPLFVEKAQDVIKRGNDFRKYYNDNKVVKDLVDKADSYVKALEENNLYLLKFGGYTKFKILDEEALESWEEEVKCFKGGYPSMIPMLHIKTKSGTYYYNDYNFSIQKSI